MADNEYHAEYAPTGRSMCKYSGCKQAIDKDTVRLGKAHPSAFHDGLTKDWYHPLCLFKSFVSAKKDTKVIREDDDIQGFLKLNGEEKKEILKHLKAWTSGELTAIVKAERAKTRADKKAEKEAMGGGATPKKAPAKKAAAKKEPAAKKVAPKFEFEHEEAPPRRAAPPPKAPLTLREKIENEIDSPQWSPLLSPFLSALKNSQQLFETPEYRGIFQSLNFVTPETVNLVCIGGTAPKNFSQGPFFEKKFTELANQFYNSKQADPNRWFQNLAQQNVLWLYGLLNNPKIDYLWVPTIVKIIKTILQHKSSSSNPNIVFALFGDFAMKLENVILAYLQPYIRKVNIRILTFPSPEETFIQNPFIKIDSSLQEIGVSPLQWNKSIQYEYTVFLEGASPEVEKLNFMIPSSAEADGSFIIGRNSFADFPINDNRISRAQLKLWPLTDPSKTLGCRVQVLGKNPINYQISDKQVLQGGQTKDLPDGASFTMILAGTKLVVRVHKTPKIVEDDEPELPIYKMKSPEKPAPKPSPKQAPKPSPKPAPKSAPATPNLDWNFGATQDLDDDGWQVVPPSKPTPVKKQKSFEKSIPKQESANLDFDQEEEPMDTGEKQRKLPAFMDTKAKAAPVKKPAAAKPKVTKPKPEPKNNKRKNEFGEDDGPPKKKTKPAPKPKAKAAPKPKKKKGGGDSDEGGDMEDGGPDSQSADDDFHLRDTGYDSAEEDRLLDQFESGVDTDELPVCQFGKGCFRKNPEHFKEYSHPWK